MDKDYINWDDLTNIINNIYEHNIPCDIVSDIINYFIHSEKNIKTYKIFNITLKNDVKYVSDNNDDYIYESISFINQYSPLLHYYDKHYIKYYPIEKNIDDSELTLLNINFNKLQNLNRIKYSIKNFKHNIDFLKYKDLKLYNFINNIYNYDYETWKYFININDSYSLTDLSFINDYLSIKGITKKEWDIKYAKKKCKIFLY